MIQITKQLKIALGGTNVQEYPVGTILRDPHPDVIASKEYYREVDEFTLEKEKTEADKKALEEEIAKTALRLSNLKEHYENRYGKLGGPKKEKEKEKEKEEDEDEDDLGNFDDQSNNNFWQDVTIDEGTKDERTERRRIPGVKKPKKK